MKFDKLISGITLAGALAAGGAITAGLVAVVRGETSGAPGITKAFSRIGKSVGQSMLVGVALTGTVAAATSLAVYEGLTAMRRQFEGV
jgi:hypothetical protein